MKAAAEPSPGCSLPQTSGSWTTQVDFDGESYQHAYTYPETASETTDPAPLILFFHGWGGSSSDCGNSCALANKRGYATIALTGIGSEKNGELNSWNGFGSTQSHTGAASEEALVAGDRYCNDSKENDRICDLDAYELGCYEDCKSCADECWWTTCKDSVQQTVDVLEDFLNNHCIEMDRIYAVGWSNGGMFTYELANDERSAKYFAAISPQIGLPHYGFNRGPHPDYIIHHLGLWGDSDDTVPPKESPSSQGCSVPCRTTESGGWFYTSSECVMDKWAADLDLTPDNTVADEYGIPEHKEILECSGFSSDKSDKTVVLGCIFDGGHDTGDYHDDITLNFFDVHYKIKNTSLGPTASPINSPETTMLPTPIPSDELSSGNPSMTPSQAPQVSLASTESPSTSATVTDNLLMIIHQSPPPSAQETLILSASPSEAVLFSPVPSASTVQPTSSATLEPSLRPSIDTLLQAMINRTSSPSIQYDAQSHQNQAPVLSLINDVTSSPSQLSDTVTTSPTSSSGITSSSVSLLLMGVTVGRLLISL